MKNVLTFFSIFVFCTGFTFAQSPDPDSTARVVDLLNDNDTTKVVKYCELGLQYSQNEQFDKSLAVLKKAQQSVDKNPRKANQALVYYISGRVYYTNGKLKESLSFLLKGLKLYEELKLRGKISACSNIIGLIYQDQTFYEKAQGYLNRALELSIERGDSIRLSGNYSNVGLNYYKQAHKKGISHEDCFEMREAVKNLNLALVVAKRMKIPSAEATALGNLSNIMNDKGQYNDAKAFAERAMKIYQNLGDSYEEAICLLDIASISLSEEKPKEAIPYLEQCLALSTANNFKDLERYVYGNLATAFQKQNDYKQAFMCEKKLIALMDSAFNSENTKQINEMQIKYETEKKETENAFLMEKNELSDKAIKNQRTVIIVVIVGLCLTVILAIFIFRGLSKQKKANRIISQQKKEVEDKNLLIQQQHELLEERQKEILDSIKYAKRIQSAQLPTEKYVSKNLDRLKK